MTALPPEVIRFRRHLKRRHYAAHTLRCYLHDLELFRAQVAPPLLQVTPDDVEKFIEAQQQKGLQATTINRRLSVVKGFYTFLRQTQHPDLVCPVRTPLHRLKQADPLPRCLSLQQLQRFFQAIDDTRDQALFTLMLRCGLRVQEVAHLELQDLDFTRRQLLIRCSKNRRDRIVYLSPDALALLQSYLQKRPQSDCATVFLVPAGRGHGQGISVRGIQKRLQHYAQKAKVRISCHQLRHTFASQLINHDTDIVTVQSLLGHAHVTTTQRYARVANPKVRDDYFEGMQKVMEQQQHSTKI